MHRLIALVTAIAFSGCAAPPARQLDAPYNPDAARGQLKPGTNTVTGGALIRQVGGGSVTCAGLEVRLVPDSPRLQQWATWRFGRTGGGYAEFFGSTNIATDPLLWDNSHKTTCDVAGRFRFANVADGDWMLFTRILWGPNPSVPHGGVLARTVSVRGGQTVEVTLAP